MKRSIIQVHTMTTRMLNWKERLGRIIGGSIKFGWKSESCRPCNRTRGNGNREQVSGSSIGFCNIDEEGRNLLYHLSYFLENYKQKARKGMNNLHLYFDDPLWTIFIIVRKPKCLCYSISARKSAIATVWLMICDCRDWKKCWPNIRT